VMHLSLGRAESEHAMPRLQLHRTRLEPLLLALVVLSGCDFSSWSQSATKATKQATQTVTETVEASKTDIQEQVGQAGSSEITLTTENTGGLPNEAHHAPAKVASNEKSTACYAIFTPGSDGRNSVLALQSYKTAEREVFPSFYIHAQVSAASLTDLAGQTVPAQMYLKSTAPGPTLFTPSDAPLQLKILTVSETEVTAEIVSGTLTSSADNRASDIAGKFTAVVP